jgi:hypothetical protein
MTNSTASVNVNFADAELVGNECKKSRRKSSISVDQLGNAHYEHRVSMPFSGTPHAVFKKGNVVRGILCPSLTNSFR